MSLPYDKLFIYEVTGEVSLPAFLTGPDYLGCWREGDCSYLFFRAAKEEVLKEYLGPLPGHRYLSETVINYEDWEAGRALEPMSIGGFHLCPVWAEPAPGPGEDVIRLDPGVAFGSGFHPTTRMCLALIDQLYQQEALPEVLDLGTGTGILSLACLARGANRVVAVDHNNLAIDTARKNAGHNGREAQVEFICDDVLKYAAHPADLALGNIYHGVLRELLTEPGFLTKRWYILSGLVGTEVDKLLTQMQSLPLEPVAVLDDNLWFAILARRGSDPI